MAALKQQVSSIDQSVKQLETQYDSINTLVSNHSSGVNQDIKRLEDSHTSSSNGLSSRIQALEASHGRMDNFKGDVSSNSSKITEIEQKLTVNKEKWCAISKLENEIKRAADKKFQLLKTEIKEEVMVEIAKQIRDEMLPKVYEQQQSFQEEVTEQHQSFKAEIKTDILKEKVYNRKLNLIFCGLPEKDSYQEELKSLRTFLKERMGLSGLSIDAHRLGAPIHNQRRPRPLVV